MKKLLIFLFAVIIALSSVSCGGGNEGTEKPSFKYESVTLDGTEVSDYTVAVTSKAYFDEAEALVEVFSRYVERDVPVKLLSDVKDSDKRIILIGAASLDGRHEKYWGLYAYGIKTYADGRLAVTVDFTNATVAESAVDRLVSLISRKISGQTVVFSIKETDHVGYSFEDKLPRWMLKDESVTELADGVTYTYQLFADEKGLPYRAYVLKIDPSKYRLYVGTANDGYDYAVKTEDRQTVMGHIDSVIGKGLSPIAGINADFFRMSGDYSPQGLCIKEGTVISNTQKRPWCGFTKDGRFVCGNAELYSQYKGELQSAVGASHLLVANGSLISMATDASHPRTLAGVAEDGTVILAVIDGRQKNHSNGADLARCAALMISHGAYNAVNLDGGGSSTMIISRDGEYETVNSPSDGRLRKVYNSLLIIPRNG